MSENQNVNEFDARRYVKPSWVKKENLRVKGPQVGVVREVNEAASKWQGVELQLLLEDGGKVSLSARDNLNFMLSAFGNDYRTWVGQMVELFFDPAVPNPNGPAGGVRLRKPTNGAAPVSFTSDLEEPV